MLSFLYSTSKNRSLVELFLGINSIVFVLLSLYLVGCSLSYVTTTANIKISSVSVLNGNGKIVKTYNYPLKDPLYIHQNEDIEITFDIERFVDGKVTIANVLRTSEGSYYRLPGHEVHLNVEKTYKGFSEKIHRIYTLPNTLEKGCTHSVYTEHNYIIKYNFLTLLNPVHIISPQINFCVK